MADNTSVGQIALDMVVNRNGFDKSLNKITGIAKKAGAIIAAAFSIKAITQFSKSCIETATKVENAWIGLNSIINGQGKSFDNAKSFIQEYISDGLVPLQNAVTAYKNLSLRGYSEKQIETVMNSLKNSATYARQSQYTLGEAITSATEGLKNENSILVDNAGVTKNVAVMWKEYAKSIGVSYTSLTKQQKIEAEVAGIMEETKFQMGDAAKYTETYSGKVARLDASFTNLKTKIGNVLKVIAGAFIPVINNAVNAIGKLVDGITTVLNEFGIQTDVADSLGSVSETADSMSSASDSAASTADSTGKTAANLKKASKFLAGFDKITKMDSQDTSSDSSGSGTASAGAGGKLNVDTTDLDKANKKLERLKKAFSALKNSFKKGFEIGFGDTSVLDSIKNNMKSIRKSMQEIVSDKAVQTAFGNMFLSLAESAGKIAGSFASIGLTIADNLTGGISKYLEQNTERIKNYLVRMFDIVAEIESIKANFMVAIADIFSVFRSDDAKQITADCIKIFSDAFMGVTELLGKIGRDIWKSLTQPFVDNKDVIKKYISDFLASIQPVMNSIAKSMEDAFDSIQHIYDNISSIIVPFIQWLVSTLIPIVLNAVSDILKAWMGLYKGVSKAVKGLFKIFEGFSDIVSGVLVGDVKKASTGAKKMFKGLKDYLEGMIEALANLIRNVFTRIVHAIAAPIKLVRAAFEKFANDCWEGFSRGIDGAISGIFDWVDKHIFQPIKKAFCSLFGIHSPSKVFQEWAKFCMDGFLKGLMKNIKSILQWFKELPGKLEKKLGNLKNKFLKKGKEIVTGLKSGAVNQWKNAKQWFKDLPESAIKQLGNIKDKFFKKGQETISGIKSGASEKWKTVKLFFTELPGKVIKAIGNIKDKAQKKGEEIISGIKKGFTVKSLKDVLVNTFKTALNAAIDVLNTAIDKINEKLTFTIKDVKLPGGKKIKGTTLNLGKLGHIQHLAQGGYVKANTPQLAMIGDNRHQGEVVAPEGKLYEIMAQVLKDFTKQNRSQSTSTQQDRDINLNLELVLGEQKFRSEVIKAVNKDRRLNGKNSIKFT